MIHYNLIGSPGRVGPDSGRTQVRISFVERLIENGLSDRRDVSFNPMSREEVDKRNRPGEAGSFLLRLVDIRFGRLKFVGTSFHTRLGLGQGYSTVRYSVIYTGYGQSVTGVSGL